jgi:DNA helicase II / ATP-dependent DNA helicase PcrA
MNFEARYKKLNQAQQQAVDTIDGPVMVIAGPGTGKTELLSMRVANILKQTDALPENILCLTFTESGASAMRERLSQIIGPSAYKVAIHTFHSFGTEIINQQGQYFYHGANFRPADELSSYEIIRGIFDELDYDNPLASKMNGEYTYLSDTLRSIAELKKSGLTSDELIAVLDQNDIALDAAEPQLGALFASRIAKTTAAELEKVVVRLRKCDDKPPVPTITSLSHIMADSLADAINQARESGKTTPITAWKNTWLKKNERGEFVLKSRERATKLRALSFVYYQYLARMQEAELYDFDDMILRVVHAMEVFPDLRFNLQEKHQYILVDEFQDTNMAQMRILLNLTTLPTGDQPNIMVVGDDDQAIYSFQGAEVGNIINFHTIYPEARLITLSDNYRSTAVILNSARSVIIRGGDRLEGRIDHIDKTLTPHHTADHTDVILTELSNVSDEYSWIVKDIQRRIKAGTAPADIAVLARRHHEIVSMLPYFVDAGLDVNYERRDNVLELDIIKHLELMGNLLVELSQGHTDHAETYLPEFLTHPAWGIDPMAIWQLGLTARKDRVGWLEVMSVMPVFVPLHRWLVATSQMIEHVPLERIFDRMIGAPHTPPDYGTIESATQVDDGPSFTSPLYTYFFSPEQLAEQPDVYLTFLEALRTIRSKLCEYRPNETPRLPLFLEFVHLHRELGSTIESIRPHVEQLTGAINLMTAHKSKGLEFDSVYIVGAIDSAWGERVRSRSSLIGYPENLPLAPTGNTPDERLRLFFVAMTRARRHLTISYSLSDSNGKQTLPASFLTGDGWQAERPTDVHTIDTLTHDAELRWYQPLVAITPHSLQELLAPTLDHYRLSATDLCTFLDVTHDGPQGFLLQRLLRFPQAASPSAAYGIAIHRTLQRAHSHLTATNRHRAVEDILHDYEQFLREQYLDDNDFQTYLQKGSDALQAFLAEKYIEFTPNQQAEISFAGQHVIVGDAQLTGSIDLLDRQQKSITVTDYKTGRPVRDWKGSTDYEKIKLHRYRQQLMFYKLLVEHARDYRGVSVDRSVLQFVEPTRSGDIITLDTTFTHDEMAEFTKLVQGIWRSIKTLVLPDTSHYEPTYKGLLAFEQTMLDQ